MLRGYTCPGERFAGAPVTAPGAARERNREARIGRARQPQLRQDVEFGAARLRPSKPLVPSAREP